MRTLGFLLFLFLTSLLISFDYGNDQSFYYATSAELGLGFKTLYLDHFTHKGPLYFFFIKIFIYLLGDNIIVYHAINVFIFISLYHVMFIKSVNVYSWKNVLLFVPIFYLTSSNGFIQMFQITLLLIAFQKLIDEQSTGKFVVSSLFFSLVFLTRIDGIIFFIAPILGSESLLIKLRRILTILFITALLLLLFKIFGFIELTDWYRDNFLFNKVYTERFSRSLLGSFYRPNLLLYTIIILFGLRLNWENSLVEGSHYYLLFSLLTFLLLLISGSEKNYHFLIPSVLMLVFFVLNNVEVTFMRIIPTLLTLLVLTQVAIFDGKEKHAQILSDINLLERHNHSGIIVGSSGFINLTRFYTDNYVKPDNNIMFYKNKELPVSKVVKEKRMNYVNSDYIFVHRIFVHRNSPIQDWMNVNLIDSSHNLYLYETNVYSK